MRMSFALQKVFNCMQFHLSIVDHRVCATGVLFRKLSPVPIFKDAPHLLCYQIWCNWIYAEVFDAFVVEFCVAKLWIYLHSSTCWHQRYTSTIWCICFLFPLYRFGFFVENQVPVDVWIYCWVLLFYSIYPIVCFYAHTMLFLLL